MLYRAINRGYANGTVIEPGDEFTFDGPAGTWMEQAHPLSAPPPKADPPTAKAEAPSTNPPLTDTSVEDLLAIHARISADLQPDQLTQSGYPKKTVLESHLGREVPKDVFFNFIKVAAEQRRAAN